MGVDLDKIRSLVGPIVQELGCEFVEVRPLTEYGRQILRILIDREGGVSVGDCQRVSREIETLLEVEGLIPQRCLLEVSSPGLDRPLVKEADFLKHVGKMIAVKTREAIEGRRNYKGFLQGIEAGLVKMLIDNKEYQVPLSLVEKAHLVS